MTSLWHDDKVSHSRCIKKCLLLNELILMILINGDLLTHHSNTVEVYTDSQIHGGELEACPS